MRAIVRPSEFTETASFLDGGRPLWRAWCPDCDSELWWTGEALTTAPEQYLNRCTGCEHVFRMRRPYPHHAAFAESAERGIRRGRGEV